jgi:hypothetical protein
MVGGLIMYRKYINIVEAANKGCPVATHDLEVTLIAVGIVIK